MITSTPALLNALAAIPVLIVRDFGSGVWIVREGDTGHSFFILVAGDVEVIKNADGPHAVTLATLHQGSFFGEMCVVEPMPRAASIRTLSQVRAIEIRAATLYRLFKQMPDQYSIVLLNLARDLARRLRKLDEAFAARSS
jgi:CRP/FNR family cyclic AMP-dependent transcriptional regulator